MSDGELIAFFGTYFAIFAVLGLIAFVLWIYQIIFLVSVPKHLKRIANALDDIADGLEKKEKDDYTYSSDRD